MIVVLENSLEQVQSLVELWNRCSSPPFLMDSRLMHQYLEAPGARVQVAGHPWQGALWSRNGSLGVTLDAVLVLPESRRRGLGRRLLQAFVASQPQATSWRFGGGSHHFVPGLPHSMAHADAYFKALGLVPDWHAHDLRWQAPSAPQTQDWDDEVYRLIKPGEIGDLHELLLHFGRRWQEDTALRCEGLRQGKPEEIMGAYHEGQLVGFCHIWSPRSTNLGPSTFWLDRSDDGWGGVGPLGVRPDRRGLGLGAGVVESSMAYLRRTGAQRIGVDWTGLPEFYQRCGFEPWLSYRGYHPRPGES